MHDCDLVLYELGGRDDTSYSQVSWRSVMAPAHKRLAVRRLPVRVSDKAAIAFSGQGKVPVLGHGAAVVADSWRIAEYLEAEFPDRRLFEGAQGRACARCVNAWVDRSLIPMLAPLAMVDVVACVEPPCAELLRSQIEHAFGRSLEALAEGREAGLARLGKALEPARAVVKRHGCLDGAAPAYADAIPFSLFQWARVTSPVRLLPEDDPPADWVERMRELNAGLARSEPARTDRAA